MALYPPTWVRAKTEEPYFSAPTTSVALVSNLGILKTPATAGSEVATVTDTPTVSMVGRETTTARQLVVSAFPDAPIMLQIAYCESGTQTPTGCIGPIRPEAKNPRSTAAGVFQILKGTWAGYGCTGDPFNASDNVRCARKIYDAEKARTGNGLSPWAASSAHW